MRLVTRERRKKRRFSDKLSVAFAIVVFIGACRIFYATNNVLLFLEERDFGDAPHEHIYAREIVEDESKWWRGQGQNKNVTHPHLGVRVSTTETSVYQMIVDPSPERLKEPQTNPKFGVDPDILCPTEAFGIENKAAKETLLKIKNGIKKNKDRVAEKKRKSKILCMVYTVDLPSSRSNLIAQVDTWGRKCDGFFAASNVTDHSNGSIDLVHEGPEAYGNMWQKVRSMWAYAYDHYLDEYDFFHIGGDDVYVVMENLRAFLDGPQVLALENGYLDELSRDWRYIENASKWLNASDNPQDENYGILGRPLWFGVPCRFRSVFPCGGPGYTLNRAALEVLGRLRLDSKLVDNIDSREDLFMGSIFKTLGIMISHTFDGVGHRYEESASSINTKEQRRFLGKPGLDTLVRNFNLTGGGDYLEGVTEEISTMHLKDGSTYSNKTLADLMYRYHAILYDLCDDNSTDRKA